jgi:hypothetical protein
MVQNRVIPLLSRRHLNYRCRGKGVVWGWKEYLIERIFSEAKRDSKGHPRSEDWVYVS